MDNSGQTQGVETEMDDYVGQQRAVDTRLTILENAAKIFAAKGFDGCSTREIAEASNVSHANIRYHFGDKESLFFKVIKYLISSAYRGRKLLSEIQSGSSPTENFRQHTRNAIQYYAHHPELPRIILFETLTRSERLDKIKPALAEVYEQRSKAISIMQDAGLVKNVDPIVLNDFFGSGLLQKFVISTDDIQRDPDALEKLIDQYTDLIVELVQN